MKEVTIKSKIVGRGGASAATSPGKGVSVDMSGYLLKQIWEKVFEFRLTDDGTEYLFAKMDMAVQGGITMYADGGNLNLKGIYDGLPIDNDTIYWDGTVLRSRGVGEGGVTPTLLGDLTNVGKWANAIASEDRIMIQKKDSSSWEALGLSKIGGSASFENVKESGNGNAFTSFTLSEDKKTLTFVKGKTFAKQSDYEKVVKDVESKANKATTLSGYGITDAYTKKDADDILAKKWTQDNTKIANWDTAFGWGNHADAGYMKKSVIYDESLKCWKLDGDLLVTGGITMYANEGKYTPSTITDAVNIDGNTLVRVNGVIMLNPDIKFGGGVADSVAWSDVTGKPTWIGNSKPSYTTSEVTEGTNLYFTNSRAVSALSNTLKGYLPLDGSTAMTGTLQSQTIRPKASDSYSLGTSTYLWSNVYTKLATIDGIGIKKSASGVLFIDANLVVSGGITMYGTDGTTVNTIWDGAPIASTSVKGIASFDSNYFAVNNGKVTFIGSTGGGGIDSITKQMVIDALGYTPYDEDDFTKTNIKSKLGISDWALNTSKPSYSYTEISGTPTSLKNPTSLSWSGYNSGSYDGSAIKSFVIPSNTNQLTNGAGFITSAGSITGNAATATTLKTSRTIWGQSFNGSGNVSGNLKLGSSNLMMESDNSYGDSLWAIFAYGPTLQFKYGSIGETASTMAFQISKTNGEIKVFGDIIPSSNSTYNLGSSSNNWKAVFANSVTFGNGVYASIKTKGWYRFATTINAENVAGGSLIFSIRRQYKNYHTESYVVAVAVGYSGVTFTQLSGKHLSNRSDIASHAMITQVRATNYSDGNVCFDFFYEGTSSEHNVYVNCIGTASLQIPTLTTDVRSYTTVFDLSNGLKVDEIYSNSYRDIAYIRRKFGKNLLTNGDTSISANSFLVGSYQCGSTVVTGRTYRITFCGKLGENNTNLALFTSNGNTHITDVLGLSRTEEKIVSLTFKMKGEHPLRFYQYPNGKFGSYIRWAYLEEAYKGGELSTTTDYNNWLAEYNKLDSRSFLYKIQRIDVGDNSYWSADKGLVVEKTWLDNTGSLSSDYWKINNSSTNPYLMLTQGSTWYIQGFEGYLYLGAGSAKSMRIDSSGNVLSVGGITMYSDLRKKTILNHVELSLNEVADAPLIEHYYNSDESKRTHVGSIAQYWAGLNDWFCKEDGEGFLTMEIQNAALASAISVARELTRYESKTDKQIKKLKKRIGELEEEIETLKKV